jgi:hypothetical protein
MAAERFPTRKGAYVCHCLRFEAARGGEEELINVEEFSNLKSFFTSKKRWKALSTISGDEGVATRRWNFKGKHLVSKI